MRGFAGLRSLACLLACASDAKRRSSRHLGSGCASIFEAHSHHLEPLDAPKRPPFSFGILWHTQGVSHDREGYALAAGLALGLIALGRGRSALGLADLHLEERLRWAGGRNLCFLVSSCRWCRLASLCVHAVRAACGCVCFRDPFLLGISCPARSAAGVAAGQPAALPLCNRLLAWA